MEKTNDYIKQIMDGKPIKITKTFRDKNCKEALVTGDYKVIELISPLFDASFALSHDELLALLQLI